MTAAILLIYQKIIVIFSVTNLQKKHES